MMLRHAFALTLVLAVATGASAHPVKSFLGRLIVGEGREAAALPGVRTRGGYVGGFEMHIGRSAISRLREKQGGGLLRKIACAHVHMHICCFFLAHMGMCRAR